MIQRRVAASLVLLGLCLAAAAGHAQSPPAAVAADPPRDSAHPARMEVVHIPSGGVALNGIVYVAAGAGPHPTVVLFHGLPGNERNLDLAQTLRRAGWTVVAANYRGSWGSGGSFRFAQTLEDARAILAFVRDPANAARLQIDTRRIALIGHSMGGWVSAMTLADDPALLGAAIISAGDFGALGADARRNHAAVAARMNENRESLAGVTGDSMADELAAHADAWSLAGIAPRLAGRRLLVLYSEDFVKAASLDLIAAMKGRESAMEAAYTPTDHSWSDARISLQAQILAWLAKLPG